MFVYPHINSVAFSVGPIKVHWYGIMYLLGFLSAWVLLNRRADQSRGAWTREQIGDVVFYAALGVVLGGRIGYMLFYDFWPFIYHPLTLFRVWDGGMSFHGGMLGVALALWLYGRHIKKPFWEMIDWVAPVVPIGLGLGRLGNFINGELWGRVTTVPWGLVYPQAGPLPRHPSELYEFLLEGLLLFIILWWYSAKPRPRGAIAACFMLGYGVFRFCVEFVRQPDPQLGFVAFGWMTRGQELSLPMVLLGGIVLIWAYRKQGR